MSYTCKYCNNIHKDNFTCDGMKLFRFLGGVFPDEEERVNNIMDYISKKER